MARHDTPTSNEIILEFVAMGNTMRVCAMDPASLTEVVVQGPINADRSSLVELAKQKLAFVIAKNGHRLRR
ncbi:MAG: DUF6898 family protein [Geminicoccaceae bacterium]|jgi:hypothetical protein